MKRTLRTVRRHWVLFTIVLICIVLAIAYNAGYRPGPGLTVDRVGTLELTNTPTGSQVFIDYGLRGTTTTGNFDVDLMPGNHTIIVNTPDRYPWSKIVTVESNKTTDVEPLMIPKVLHTTVLSGSSAKDILALAAKVKLPDSSSPLVMGCSHVSVANNQVIADAATTSPQCVPPPAYLCSGGTCGETVVYSPVETITAIAPYPGRTDAVLVGTAQHLYAVGLDPRSPQTFAPLIAAAQVQLITDASGSTYISDGTGVYKISF